MKKWLFFLFTCCLAGTLTAQSGLIQLGNPSFEDVPGPGRPPLGWYFCGPLNETPPDVQPVPTMNVHLPARHGKTYAGLVTRDNATQEALGQALSSPILAGHCYLLRINAARSATFSSYSRLTELPADFSQPVRLQLWGGKGHCQMQELLAETLPVQDTVWKVYELNFSPQEGYDQLFIKVAYAKEGEVYNGHVLIDHLSPIVEMKCIERTFLRWENKNDEVLSTGSDDQLADLIEEELPKVRWVNNGFTLEQQLLPPAANNHNWTFGNPGIYQIAQLLKDHPDALLTVAVGPRKDPLLQHHIRLIAAEFMAAGLSAKQCLIRPLKKRDMKRNNWLKTAIGGQDILWGVDY